MGDAGEGLDRQPLALEGACPDEQPGHPFGRSCKPALQEARGRAALFFGQVKDALETRAGTEPAHVFLDRVDPVASSR